ncbi:AAA family ATPase [Saccharothrix sp. S26]|uniref:dTMP kinase n=1 Tax=Saccharothrix sp. S26 TaxID=2907215 RepID=UPI001F27C292|nr:AAA family ATPase [Saccharothrix sp. S26]MCE6995010.1 AAA family ATPase [Saccharothrix sp. S26]
MAGESPERGRWICVDGVEGVGKTTIARALADAYGAHLAPEFSAASFGRALADAVRETPHLIAASGIGQSLVFLGDFYEVHASAVAPLVAAGATVVSDRGYLSKYAYQDVVLGADLGETAARELLDGVFRHLPTPDLTLHLVAPRGVLRERLVARDGYCDDARLAFMERAHRAALRRSAGTPALRVTTIDAGRSPRAVLSDAVAAVAALGPPTRHSRTP